jgi:hypothetical protein
MGRLFVLMMMAGATAAVVVGLPDIKRYLKMRAM